MKTFDSAIVSEIAKENLKPFFMIELQLDTTVRWNDIDIDVYDDDENKFSPVAFSFGSIVGSSNMSVESIDIEVDDTNQAVSAMLLGEDVRNKIAIMSFGVLISPTVWDYFDSILDFDALTNFDQMVVAGSIEYQELFRGIIGEWELYEDNKAKITITSEMVLWNKKCLRPQTSSCPWAFKGTSGECGYTGAETLCDQSYDRCLALANTDNYGGDRFLPAIVSREIWWGRTQGKT